MTKIELGKTYRTRDGKEARVYATDHGTDVPIVGAIKIRGEWRVCRWFDTGLVSRLGENNVDLIEVKPRIKREVWVNVYRDGCGTPWNTRAEADKHPGNRIACIPITIDCEEGEGL